MQSLLLLLLYLAVLPVPSICLMHINTDFDDDDDAIAADDDELVKSLQSFSWIMMMIAVLTKCRQLLVNHLED